MACTVKCPSCGASYKIDESKLGKTGRCSACGNRFTLTLLLTEVIEPLVPEIVEPDASGDSLSSLAAAASVSKSTPRRVPKRKSSLDKAKEWTEQARQRVNVTYIQGPWDIKANSAMTLLLGDTGLTLQIGLINKREFHIPYDSITGMTVDTAERLGKMRTLGAYALGGSLAAAFVGFGMKKKDKFLNLDFTDDTGTAVSVIFGKALGCNIPTLQGRILQAKHDYLASRPKPEADVVEGEPIQPSPDTDIAATIENLAQLRDKGIITEEEFQAKKAELLSRM